MSTTTLSPSAAAVSRLDWPFLIAAVLATAVLVALVVTFLSVFLIMFGLSQ